MTRQIVIEGSKKQIADQITAMADHVVRAILLVESDAPDESAPLLVPTANSPEDLWTQDLRRWAAGHKRLPTMASDDRDSIYADRLQ